MSCGAQLPADPPLLETEDITFRLLHRDTPIDRLVVSHKTLVRKWAVEDLNVAYPIDRLRELEAALPFSWSADGDRSWETTTDDLYRNGGFAITSAHMAAHAAVGESLVGKERAFAVKCNC